MEKNLSIQDRKKKIKRMRELDSIQESKRGFEGKKDKNDKKASFFLHQIIYFALIPV